MQVTNEHMRIGAVPFTSDEQASWAMSLTGVATAKSRERASSRSNAILITISMTLSESRQLPCRLVLLPAYLWPVALSMTLSLATSRPFIEIPMARPPVLLVLACEPPR